MVEWKKLGEVCTKITDGSHNPPIGVDYSLNRMISSQNVYNGHIDFSSVRYLSDADFEKEDKRTNAKKGDVVLTIVGTIGRCCVLDGNEGNIAFQRSVALLKPSNAIKSSFLMHYLINNNKHLNSQSNGGAQKGIYLKQLERILIPIPPLSEQQRIVEQLDTFTASIDNLKEQIAQRRKQYEYYRDELLDLEGKEGVRHIVLKDVCDIINGRAYSQPELLSEGKYRVLRVGNFFSNDSWYYSDFELEDKYYCNKGDLLYAWSASFGPHIWDEEKVIYHYHIWKMNCSDCLNKKFMFYWLQSEDMRKQAFSNLHGATMAHLTKALMESLMVPIPSLSEQQRIVSILDTFEDSIQNLEAQLEQRQKQYEYYRNKLLTFE